MQSGQREASTPLLIFSLIFFSLLGATLDRLSTLDTLSTLDSLSNVDRVYSIPCSAFEPKMRSVFSIKRFAMSFLTARRMEVSGMPLRSDKRLLLMKQVSLPHPHESR